MRKARVTQINNKNRLRKMFTDGYKTELFDAEHNPFLQSTDYEIHISTGTKNPYASIGHHYKLIVTVQWGENGYKYKTLKQLVGMIKRDFPHYLV
jgi:hypothetical protein